MWAFLLFLPWQSHRLGGYRDGRNLLGCLGQALGLHFANTGKAKFSPNVNVATTVSEAPTDLACLKLGTKINGHLYKQPWSIALSLPGTTLWQSALCPSGYALWTLPLVQRLFLALVKVKSIDSWFYSQSPVKTALLPPFPGLGFVYTAAGSVIPSSGRRTCMSSAPANALTIVA